MPAIPAISQVATKWPQYDHHLNAAEGQVSVWESHRLVVICIIFFISASRLGRWTSSLCSQQLAQSCIPSEQRSMFAGTEASLASTFSLGHWVATVIWSKHWEFQWIALSSLLVTVGSTCLWACWLLSRGRRVSS